MRERLAGQDGAWLRMEAPLAPMQIVVLFLLERLPDERDLIELLHARFLAYERFRLVLGAHGFGPPRTFRESPVDLRRHLSRARPADLRAHVARRLAEPLEPRHPRWHFELLEGEAPALLLRIHHAYADGTALLHVLLALTEGPAEPLPRWALGGGGRGLGELARAAPGAGMALARVLARRPDPPSLLRNPLGPEKRVAWTEALPLAPLLERARARSVKLHALLVAALAGALRRYLQARGEVPRDLRALVPVDLRPPAWAAALGNRFGLVFVELPIGVAGAGARLREAHERMEALKRSAEPAVTLALLQAIGSTTPGFEAALVRFFSKKASLVLTDVAGPAHPRALAGAPIRDLVFWVPAAGGITMGASIFSYAGRLRLSLRTEAHLVPDPEAIARAFERELEAL